MSAFHLSQRAAFAGLLACLLSSAAPAQAPALEGRVGRLEQEMRAVQRKVFPGGAGAVLQPDIATPETQATPAGSPATTPVADLTARVSAIETQLARLTGQVEQNDYRLKQLEQALADMKAAQAPPPAPALPVGGDAGVKPPVVKTPATPGKSAAADPNRAEAVGAIEPPSTGNAPLDSYTYGYRLWAAKFYPEAQTQLQATLDKYGSTSVASRAANLLGRAYLDDGKPVTAAKILYENYRLRPKGDRAAESLAYTAEALTQAKDLQRACLAYDELGEVFGASLAPNLKTMMEKGRARAKCGA